MRNKGFTLVELLGVIVLLGILGIVIIPKVGDSITNSKETALKTQEESIKKAAYDFLIDNTEFLEENDTITIKLGVLKQKGYLPVNIKNPKTRKNISNESLITVTKINGTYKISLALVDLENVTENIDDNSPILVLNGDYIEYVEVNDLYEEKGAIAKSATGETINNVSKQIKLNNVEKSSIDTSQLLTYNIIYSVTDSNGLTTSATRTVIVRDTKSPTITFPTETDLHVSELADFNIMNRVSVTDNYDTNPTLTVNSSIAQIAGKYVVTYSAKDSSGNETIERRVISVNDDYSRYYTNIEYLESTGTQYIDTGFIPNQNTGFDIDFITYNKVSTTNNEYATIFGARKNLTLGYQLSTWGNQTSLKGHFLYGSNSESASSLRYNAGIISETRQQIKLRNRLMTQPNGTTTTLTNYQFKTPGTLIIFGLKVGNTSIIEKSSTKLYNFKLFDGDTLIRNMIPAVRNSDNKPGLYDLINNKFYTNAGTGEFIKGNSIN